MRFGDRYSPAGDALDGGMGTVYPCKDEILERAVAIKVIQGASDERRMLDEVSALLKLRSKHVVQVYDLLRLPKNSLAIVQEFINGPDLLHPSTKANSPDQLYKQLWQISAGIADIHDAGIIHRDIKPNNMKVDHEGVVKIFDFGLARSEGPEASTLGFVGTPGFAAPELIADNPKFTPAVDVYAFGATALFLMTRGLPRQLTSRPPQQIPQGFLDQLQTGLSTDVLRMIEQCLSHAPNARPSMLEMKHVLAKHLLLDRHQGLLVYRGKPSYLNSGNRTVAANLDGMGGIKISYNGFEFSVTSITGDVFINNQRATLKQVLPDSCVIALGAPEQANRRHYITFDLSSPEVVL